MNSENSVFRTQRTITFRDCDPAQILFFGHVFGFAHDAFEQFLLVTGYTWKEWFQSQDYLIPIRHTEGDYKIPFFPGETYEIAVSVANLGETSFKMKYIFQARGQVHASVTMVHAFVDAHTKQKISLPALLISRFEKFLEKGNKHE